MSRQAKPELDSGRRTVTLERTYRATLRDVWELWTTKEGIESWWGPDGFQVTVLELDLRTGGQWHYRMTAVGPEQVAFMESEGMPLSSDVWATFSEVTPMRRLGYECAVDFVPGVAQYRVMHAVELQPLADGQVKMTLTIGAMHDDEWTERAVAGFISQLERLDALLGSRNGEGA